MKIFFQGELMAAFFDDILQEYAAWFNLGNVQVKLEDYPAAFMAYERAAGLAPGIAGYRLREAMMMFQVRPTVLFLRLSRIANGIRDDHISPYKQASSSSSSHRHAYYPPRHASFLR